jgi:tetratricopeptide (TPR) repeat protein
MDQLSAHLDRGWDLAQKGDGSGALACARRALELDPKSPEVHNLLGFAAALEGDTDEALEHYKQAIALDETYLEAMLNAAEVLVSPLGEWDEALELCNDALDYAETDEEIADCVLLKVDALMGKGDPEGAKKALGMMPSGPFENGNHEFLIGRAHYELGDLEKAAPIIESAAQKDGQHADARYYLGLVRDEKGDAHGATEAFLHARALDALRPPPSWSPSPEAFGQLVRQVVEKLDALLARYVKEAEVFCFDVVGAELVVDGVDPRALVIVDAPPVRASADGQDAAQAEAPPKARIFVYQRSVERAAGSLEALEQELTRALEHEIATLFVEAGESAGKPKGELN